VTIGAIETPQPADVSTDDRHWQLFATAKTADEFCRAWLALLCRQLGNVAAGVVLLESGESNTFVPIAVWPEPVGDLSRLSGIAESVLSKGQAVIKKDRTTQIGYPILAMERTVGVVALEVLASDEARIGAAARQLHWGIAWISDLLHRRELERAGAGTERMGSVMEAVATALRGGKLQQTMFEVANHLAKQLRCSRVAIGLAQGHRLKLVALSDAAWVEKASGAAKRYIAAMEEAFDRRQNVDASAPAHQLLMQETGAASVLSVPLITGASCVGVVTLERAGEEPFGEPEQLWLQAFAGLLPQIIEQKTKAGRGYFGHLRDDLRALLTRLFGPRHLVWKFGSTVLLLALAVLTLVELDYRVSAKTVIEGEIQRVAAAPFEGFIAASHVRAGDLVSEGQLLVELDDRDLKVEHAKWTSEREQHERKLREAMANGEMAAVQVIGAQLRQAEAQVALAAEKLKRTKIAAPFDGVVVSGDLSQLIGSPVENGKKLFEIAPLSSYRVILQIDEREIRHVEVGQGGRLVISGIAGDPVAFRVSKVTPVATAQDGRNFFRVEAQLEQAPPRLRPGMEGVGKVSVGEQRLWWVLTHSFTDWLRLQLWNWTL
jgi:hypothetical protein